MFFNKPYSYTKYIDLRASGCMGGCIYYGIIRGSFSNLFPQMRNDEIQVTRFGRYLQGGSGFILLLTCLSPSLHDTFGQINSNLPFLQCFEDAFSYSYTNSLVTLMGTEILLKFCLLFYIFLFVLKMENSS